MGPLIVGFFLISVGKFFKYLQQFEKTDEPYTLEIAKKKN